MPSPPGPIQAVFLDLPLAAGGSDDHLPWIAVTGDPWTDRAAIYRSLDDETYDLIATIAKPAIVGTTMETLASAQPGRWQRVSLRVILRGGGLESADRLRVLNGVNRAAVEFAPDQWEIIQFRDADLVAPGEYVLGTLLRGQRGTDISSAGSIATGARFVLLDDAVKPVLMAHEDRSLARHFRAGPARFGPAHETFSHSIESFDAVGLRPFAPAHLHARRDSATSDLAISWVRTERISAESWQGIEAPQSEEREEYRLRILNGGNLLREESLAAPDFTYTTTMQAADAAGSPLELRVARLSTTFVYGPERVLITDE